jgi:uncharacterized protein YjbI with pentapeptide repeats
VRSIRCAALVALLVAAGACGSETVSDESVGDCVFEPGAVCREQDLQNVSFVAADLRGADFSGANLQNADLRDSDLSDAKLVGTILAGTNLAGANLTNADMTRAFLFGTNLSDANLDGVQDDGAQRCNVTEPDGSFTSGAIVGPDGREEPCDAGDGEATTPTTARPVTEPPRVAYFRPAKPERCITDVAGTGIEIEWWIPNANSMTFYVDGIRIESASKPRGVKRVPFICDGKQHIVSVEAFGAVEPKASGVFTASLDPTAPLTPDD